MNYTKKEEIIGLQFMYHQDDKTLYTIEEGDESDIKVTWKRPYKGVTHLNTEEVCGFLNTGIWIPINNSQQIQEDFEIF